MPGQDYELDWIIKPDRAIAGARAITTELLKLEAICDRLGPKLKSLANGASAPLGTMARSARGLADRLGELEVKTNGAQKAISSLSTTAGQLPRRMDISTRSIAGFITAGMAMSAVRQTFSAIVGESEKIEAHWKKLAEESVAFRDSLRELASIRGERGPNNKVIANVLDMSVATNMIPDKAREFIQAYENIGPTVRDKGHYKPAQGTVDQLEQDVLVQAGRGARRLGIDEKAAGEGIGVAGMFHTFRSPEQAMDVFGAAMKGLSQGKLEYTPGVRALNKASAKLVDPNEAMAEGAKAGRIGGYDEAGVYMGALSLGTGTADQAAHRMVQNSRVLNPQNEEAQAALASMGVTNSMSDPEKLIALSKGLTNVPDKMKWLKDNGLGSDATREGVIASLKVADVLEKRLSDMRATKPGAAFIDDNSKSIATDRAAMAQQATVIKEVMDQVQGEQVEPLETAKKLAEERIRLAFPNHASSVSRSIAHAIASPFTFMGSGVGGQGEEQEGSLDESVNSINTAGLGAIPTIQNAGTKVGIDVKSRFPGLNSGSYTERAAAFRAAAEAITAKGGDPYGRAEVEAKARGEIGKMNGAAPGAAAGPGAIGGPNAKVDAADQKEAGRIMLKAAELMVAAASRNGRGGGGSASGGSTEGMGGSYQPYRA